MCIPIRENSSLGELAGATGCLETVLLSFLHTRVSRKETGLLERSTECVVSKEECSGNAVTDCTGLTGDTAALYVCNDIKLTLCTCYTKGLVDDELECFKTEVIFYIASVDGDFTCTGIETNSCNRTLSSARTVKIRFSTCIHYLYLSFLISQLRTEQASEPAAYVRCPHIPSDG